MGHWPTCQSRLTSGMAGCSRCRPGSTGHIPYRKTGQPTIQDRAGRKPAYLSPSQACNGQPVTAFGNLPRGRPRACYRPIGTGQPWRELRLTPAIADMGNGDWQVLHQGPGRFEPRHYRGPELCHQCRVTRTGAGLDMNRQGPVPVGCTPSVGCWKDSGIPAR